jgi:hypothetical protein
MFPRVAAELGLSRMTAHKWRTGSGTLHMGLSRHRG